VTAVQLSVGLWRVPTAPADLVDSYLLADDDGSLTLVDAGLKNAHRKVVAALAELGKAPADVQRIVMAHAHADHAGGLAGGRTATGARVLAHQVEAPYLAFTHGPQVGAGARPAVRAFLAGRPS
jgi:glyoxylase-like metal-dependent hydrolase (beta-lactamase superfamily II)